MGGHRSIDASYIGSHSGMAFFAQPQQARECGSNYPIEV